MSNGLLCRSQNSNKVDCIRTTDKKLKQCYSFEHMNNVFAFCSKSQDYMYKKILRQHGLVLW